LRLHECHVKSHFHPVNSCCPEPRHRRLCNDQD
jgi:hypothetical protein